MYLKRLTCQGFKSFADKIEFDFQPGVTGIVGPNGCGKSNVVDAVKWVLGDQSPRSLRGKQMQDVIFNGSGTRRSLSMAQVDLLFSNHDRRLSLDTDEVNITRRLYRSGESEYLINAETVRLRDVRELFMDTGVGVGAYSIIEQGKVDILLQASPLERRTIFEEAAGISRYKARKREAERKLERVQQNLLRLEDIIDEVQKRLRSIKYQAGKARSFQEYDRQLRERKASHSLAEYHRQTQRAKGIESESASLEDRATALRTAIATAEARDASLENELLRLETDLRQVEQQVLTNASQITAHRERITQSRQRMEELGAVRGRAQQRLAAERRRTIELRGQLKAEESAAQALEGELQAAHAAVDEFAVQDREHARELTVLQARHEDEKAGIIDLLRRTAQLTNAIESLAQRREHLEDERGRLSARHDLVRAELEDLLRAKAQMEARANQVAELIQAQTEQLEHKRQDAARLDATRAELHQHLSAAKEYRSGLLSRKQLLADLDRQLEGVDAGVRELLHRKEQDQTGQTFSYVQGLVADLIAADMAGAKLIETALGEHDQYVVIDDTEAFLADSEVIDELPGRVRAICLDRLPPFIDGRDFTEQEGFVAHAMDLVRYPPEAERLVRHLLGRTIIVDTLSDAVRLCAQNPPIYRYVTRSGQLYDPDGRCQLGPAGGRAGLISRKSELREIDTQISGVDERVAIMADRLDRTTAEIEHLEKVQEELRSALHEAHKAQAENNAALGANQNAVQRLMQEQPLIAGEVESLEMQIREAIDHSTQSSASLNQIEQDNREREQRVRQIAEQIDQVVSLRSQLAERLTEAKVTVGQLIQRRGMVADRLRGVRELLQANQDGVRASTQEVDDAEHRHQQAERTILTAQCRLAELFAAKEQLDQQMRTQQRTREQIRLEQEQLATQTRTNRSTLTQAEEDLHARRLELQEVRIRLDELVLRVRAELNVDLAEAYASYQHQEQDWDAVAAEIEELREKIRRLGNVNLDAIAEQEELEKRDDFLTSQHHDLDSSRHQLEQLIEELNGECRQRFTQTFEAVRGHFQELFRKLFGGGKADVLLEPPPEGQPLDVLEAGIEIQARPPGKEVQSISLMSGGEKTLTALALLLAIFRSRPSPFAILDEVDAALDEANNERFNRIIGEFLDRSQFMVITHSKRTMMIADILYGITMQEAGVSKRVSVRFDHADDPTAAVA